MSHRICVRSDCMNSTCLEMEKKRNSGAGSVDVISFFMRLMLGSCAELQHVVISLRSYGRFES